MTLTQNATQAETKNSRLHCLNRAQNTCTETHADDGVLRDVVAFVGDDIEGTATKLVFYMISFSWGEATSVRAPETVSPSPEEATSATAPPASVSFTSGGDTSAPAPRKSFTSPREEADVPPPEVKESDAAGAASDAASSEDGEIVSGALTDVTSPQEKEIM